MRYLKRFNEGIQDDIVNFSHNYLAFLFDDGLKIRTTDNTKYNSNTIYVEFIMDDLVWDDIKDYFIPYFEYIDSNYGLVMRSELNTSITFSYTDADDEVEHANYSLESIVNDETEKLNNKLIYSILFYINKI